MSGNYYRQGGYPYNYPGRGYGMNQGDLPQGPYGGRNESYGQQGQGPTQIQGCPQGAPPQGSNQPQQQPQTQSRSLPPSQMPSSHHEPSSSGGASDKSTLRPGMRGGAGEDDSEPASSGGEEKKKPRAGVYRKRGVDGMEYGVIGSDGSSMRVKNGFGRFFW